MTSGRGRADRSLATGRAGDEAAWPAAGQPLSPDAREHIFSTYAPFARQIAARLYRDRRGDDLDPQDLRQMAYAGLLEAIDRFDATRGVPFRAYASRRISGAVSDGIAKLTELREQASFRRRVRAERVKSLSAEYPDGLSTDEAMQALAEIAEGLALGFMLEGSALAASEDAADDRPSAYDSLAWKDTMRRLAAELAALPAREQTIIREHYLGDMTFDQIGAALGVTKGRVSQLHRAALELLRRRMSKGGNFRLER